MAMARRRVNPGLKYGYAGTGYYPGSDRDSEMLALYGQTDDPSSTPGRHSFLEVPEPSTGAVGPSGVVGGEEEPWYQDAVESPSVESPPSRPMPEWDDQENAPDFGITPEMFASLKRDYEQAKTGRSKEYTGRYPGLAKSGHSPREDRGRVFNTIKAVFDDLAGTTEQEWRKSEADRQQGNIEVGQARDDYWRGAQRMQAQSATARAAAWRKYQADLSSWDREMLQQHRERMAEPTELDRARTGYLNAQTNYLERDKGKTAYDTYSRLDDPDLDRYRKIGENDARDARVARERIDAEMSKAGIPLFGGGWGSPEPIKVYLGGQEYTLQPDEMQSFKDSELAAHEANTNQTLSRVYDAMKQRGFSVEYPAGFKYVPIEDASGTIRSGGGGPGGAPGDNGPRTDAPDQRSDLSPSIHQLLGDVAPPNAVNPDKPMGSSLKGGTQPPGSFVAKKAGGGTFSVPGLTDTRRAQSNVTGTELRPRPQPSAEKMLYLEETDPRLALFYTLLAQAEANGFNRDAKHVQDAIVAEVKRRSAAGSAASGRRPIDFSPLPTRP
jgi:hypothetical protein